MQTNKFTPIGKGVTVPMIPQVNIPIPNRPTDQNMIGRLPVITPMVPVMPQVPVIRIPTIQTPPVRSPTVFPVIQPLKTITIPVVPTPKARIPIIQIPVPQPQVNPYGYAIPEGEKPGIMKYTIPQVQINDLIPQMRTLTLNVKPKVATPKAQPRAPTTGLINMTPIPTPQALPTEVRDLILRPWQTAWAQRAYNILLRNHGYIDTSRMGSGKTYVTLWLAKQFGFRLFIVCPVIMIDIWRRTAAEYGVEVVDIISYQSLRSQRDHQPKHGYLNRFDNTTEGGIHQVQFTPTQPYLDLIDQGVMVIFDEIQNIKNNSAQYKACNALIRPIISTGGRSRFGLLSGTPFDKEEHAINLLRLIGYIRAHRLYNYVKETKQLVLEGIQELIDACRAINAEETERVLIEIPLAKAKMSHLCYTLYTRVVKAGISGAMPAPTTIRGEFDVKNGFYNMTAERTEQLQNAINELAAAIHFNERTGQAEMRAESIGAVTTALVHIENAKVDDFARVATQILMANGQNKVIVCVNYTSTIDEVARLLVFFNPLILNGQIPANKRGAVVRLFNEDPTRRVLIMNTAVGGVGISLHDTRGDSPRFMLMSPSYKLLELTQAAGRIYRDGTMTDATVRMFYGKGVGGRETGILSAMARKTQVLKGTLETDVTRDLILPGDYQSEMERDN